MTIHQKIAGVLWTVLVATAAVSYVLGHWVIQPVFTTLENESAKRDIERVIQAIQRDIQGIGRTAMDWSAWDETYRYVQDRNREFAEENLLDKTFENTELNVICIRDSQGEIIWSRFFDATQGTPVVDRELEQYLQASDTSFTAHRHVQDINTVIVGTREHLVLLAVAPIVTTHHEGPIRGSMIMGRFLDERETHDLGMRTATQLRVRNLCAAEHSSHASDHPKATLAPQITVKDQETLSVRQRMSDPWGREVLEAELIVPRKITHHGRVAAQSATLLSLLSGLVLFGVVSYVLTRQIVHPVQSLANQVKRIGTDEHTSPQIVLSRRDELGFLANAFNDMLNRLREAQKRELSHAHAAGQMEIATEVLHNIGNTVNSASCAAQMIEETLISSRLGDLERSVALLNNHAHQLPQFFAEDPRGPRWASFVSQLADHLRRERDQLLFDTRRLQVTMHHIRDAIASQQIHAGSTNFREEVDICQLWKETVRLIEPDAARFGIHLHLHIDDLPMGQLNRSQVFQILLNLCKNAVDSIAIHNAPLRQIDIEVSCREGTDLECQIRDTGGGFDLPTARQLFQHGFTTKANGHGYGLHYCALVLKHMGGGISAHSPGVDQGATFRFHIPQVWPATAQEAVVSASADQADSAAS